MKKLLSTTLAVGILASMSFSPVFALDAGALPTQWNNGLDNKNVDITQQDKNMNVQITGGQGSVGQAFWDKFNVGSDAKVNFEFTAHNQTAFNEVKGTNMSQIYGQITNSSCAGCGYDYAGTGKVILVNPNGVFFGETANVNVNSFTVTNMNAQYDKESNTLKLTKKAQAGERGIEVKGGAKIHGDKGVTIAADNKVLIYKDSLISTNTKLNGNSKDLGDNNDINAAYGKVKIVTADGVNFVYHNNGAVKEIPASSLKGSSDKMTISLNGNIDSGSIDIRNYSSNKESELSVNGATLKATKAVKGNDGNIWLTASNTINVNDTSFTTVNAQGAEALPGGDVVIQAANDVRVGAGEKGSNINAVGNVIVGSSYGDAVIAGTRVNAGKDVNVTAGKLASIQTDKGKEPNIGSIVTAKNVNIKGTTGAAVQAKVTADNITLEGGYAQFANADLTATGTISATSKTGDVYGSANFNNGKTNLKSAKDINLKAEGVGNSEKGLVAVAENNLSIETTGDLSIADLEARNGNMHLKSNKLVMGKDYVNPEWQIENDGNRSYIYVLNGTFDSVDLNGNENFNVTLSDSQVGDTNQYARHHIEGKNNTGDKFLLINKRPFEQSKPRPSDEPIAVPAPVDDTQAQYLNKMPRQPEVFNNNTVVNNGRTALVDVFAAASQIEIEDDEEE